MRLQGDSFRKIARTLNEEGVPSPRGFYYMAEGRPNLRGETPHWNDVTVKTILRNEVCLGHMVQNKTGTVSYKVHKQVSKPKEGWIKVEHTHEPLVSREVWDAVQRLDNHPSKGRSGSDGQAAGRVGKAGGVGHEDKVKGIMSEALCVQPMNRLLQIFSFRRILILSYKFAIFFP